MQIKSREHYELMDQFEKRYKEKPKREEKSFWPKGAVYCNGETNRDFLNFREGYSFGRAVYLNQ